MKYLLNKNKGFTLVELMVVIFIITVISISIVNLSQILIKTLNLKNLNNEFNYSFLFLKDLEIPSFITDQKDDPDLEKKYLGLDNGHLHKNNISYEIPYINIFKTVNVNGSQYFDISKNILRFSLEDNYNRNSSLYTYSTGDTIKLEMMQYQVNGIVLIKGLGYNYDSVGIEQNINNLGSADITIFDKRNGKIIFKYYYDNNDNNWKYKSDFDNIIINPNSQTVFNDKIKIGISYINNNINNSIYQEQEEIDDLNFKILKLKVLDTWKDCIIQTPKNSNIFKDEIIKYIIKTNVYNHTFNLEKQESKLNNNICDYDMIFPILGPKY